MEGKKLEKKFSLAEQYQAVKNAALGEIRTNGDKKLSTDSEETFGTALSSAEEALQATNKPLALSRLVRVGISKNTATTILFLWERMHLDHPEGMSNRH